jgi:hypothetical protein
VVVGPQGWLRRLLSATRWDACRAEKQEDARVLSPGGSEAFSFVEYHTASTSSNNAEPPRPPMPPPAGVPLAWSPLQIPPPPHQTLAPIVMMCWNSTAVSPAAARLQPIRLAAGKVQRESAVPAPAAIISAHAATTPPGRRRDKEEAASLHPPGLPMGQGGGCRRTGGLQATPATSRSRYAA